MGDRFLYAVREAKNVTLTIAGYDFTEKLVDFGTEVNADINDTFGMLAKEKSYTLKDYDDSLNPFADEGFFAINNYRGQEIIEKDDSGLVVFRGTVQKVAMTDAQECIVTATEPLTLFLEWDVEASDRTTHTGFTVDGASGQTIGLAGGATSIPSGAVVWFNDTKVPSYSVVTSTGSPTTSITIDRPLEGDLDDGLSVTVAVPAITTGPLAIKQALETSNPGILLDGTFDILHILDSGEREIRINVMEQDGIKLREHLSTLMSMCDLLLTQKNDGRYTLRRGLEYDGSVISDTLTGAEICGPVEPYIDDSQLIIGYDLIYQAGDNVAALIQADVDPNYVRKFNGIKYWQPVKSARSFAEIKYMYADAISAEYFGQRRLSYYAEPRKVIMCSCKPALNSDANIPINLYLGKQVRATVRTFVNVPAIVTGFSYSEQTMSYTNVKLQLNTGVPRPVDVTPLIICEDGAFLTTESSVQIRGE